MPTKQLKRATGHGKAVSGQSTDGPQPGDWVRWSNGRELVIADLFAGAMTDNERVLASCLFGPNTWVDLTKQPERVYNSHEQQARRVWRQWTKESER